MPLHLSLGDEIVSETKIIISFNLAVYFFLHTYRLLGTITASNLKFCKAKCLISILFNQTQSDSPIVT